MPIADRILTYSVYLFQSNLVNYGRVIRLSLESGGSASIQFPQVRPTPWLQFSGNETSLYMVQDQFTDVYHLLQTEKPVFFTAADFEGIQGGECIPSSTSPLASRPVKATRTKAWRPSFAAPPRQAKQSLAKERNLA